MKVIEIKGVIVSNNEKEAYNFYDVESTCPYDVTQHLTGNEDIEVIINSGGGDVFAGSEIYTALRAYQGNVTVKVYSLAASSASIIAMAGDRIEMSPTSMMMIHNVSAPNGGDYHAHEHTAELLKTATKALANAYCIKTGLDEATILEMMDKETWLNPQQAIELKFADATMFENSKSPMALVANFNGGKLPHKAIEQFNNALIEKMNIKNTTAQKKMSAQLSLLKLKSKEINTL